MFTAFVSSKGLGVTDGTLELKAGQPPRERLISWVPASHPQFDAAVEHCRNEGWLS